MRITSGHLDRSFVKVVIPRNEYSLSNRIIIKTRGGSISSKELFRIRQLKVTDISPMNPNYHEEVIIKGQAFPKIEKIKVLLKGEEVPITHASPSEIRFLMPNINDKLFQTKWGRVQLDISIKNFIYDIKELTVGNDWYRIGYPNYIANQKIYGFASSPSSYSDFLIHYQDALDGSFNINPVDLHGTIKWLNPIKVYTDFNYIESVSTF